MSWRETLPSLLIAVARIPVPSRSGQFAHHEITTPLTGVRSWLAATVRPVTLRTGRDAARRFCRATWPVGVLASLALSVPGSANAAGIGTQAFTTSGEQSFTVPAAVTSVQVTLVGGNGGNGQDGGTGGIPATVTATLAVVPGQTLYAEVAGNGTNGGTPAARPAGTAAVAMPVQLHRCSSLLQAGAAVGAPLTCAPARSTPRADVAASLRLRRGSSSRAVVAVVVAVATRATLPGASPAATAVRPISPAASARRTPTMTRRRWGRPGYGERRWRAWKWLGRELRNAGSRRNRRGLASQRWWWRRRRDLRWRRWRRR